MGRRLIARRARRPSRPQPDRADLPDRATSRRGARARFASPAHGLAGVWILRGRRPPIHNRHPGHVDGEPPGAAMATELLPGPDRIDITTSLATTCPPSMRPARENAPGRRSAAFGKRGGGGLGVACVPELGQEHFVRSWLSRPRRMNWPVNASSSHKSVAMMTDWAAGSASRSPAEPSGASRSMLRRCSGDAPRNSAGRVTAGTDGAGSRSHILEFMPVLAHSTADGHIQMITFASARTAGAYAGDRCQVPVASSVPRIFR